MTKKYVWIYTGEGKQSKRFKLLDVDILTANMLCKDIEKGSLFKFSRKKLNLFATINKGLKFN